MVTKELRDKIRAGIVKGEPVKCDGEAEEHKFYESDEVRRDI